MAVFHAKHHTFLIGQESVFGTAVSATKDVGLVQSFTPSDKRTIEEVYEPFLIQQGFIQRTPRGREATDLAYKRFNKRRYC